MTRFTCLPALVFLAFTEASAQRTDSTLAIGGITRDTFYIIHENIPKSKVWGNSYHISAAYNLSRTNEFDINIGRTYGSSMCGGGGCYFNIRSWGLGYGLATNGSYTKHLVKAFWEYTFFPLPPAGVRAEYIYNITDNTHYLRPSVGISLFRFDVFYNYSFNLNGIANNFRHGVSFRVKFFHRKKNWERNYPSRC